MAFDQQIFSTALDKNLIQMKHIVSLIILLNLTPFEKPGPGQHKLTIDWEKQTQPEKNQNRTHFESLHPMHLLTIIRSFSSRCFRAVHSMRTAPG